MFATDPVEGRAARDVAAATGLRVVALRYFNVAGAARPELGDPGVFNLIPMAFDRSPW